MSDQRQKSTASRVSGAVSARAELLQSDRLDNAGARLAGLRRNINAPAGSDPRIWADTIGIVPADLRSGGDSGPSSWEAATHLAMALFATHRQGGVQAHQRGQSMGAAVRALIAARGLSVNPYETPEFKRFQSLVTVSSDGALRNRLRAMVVLLRGAGIALDYGRLCTDIRGMGAPTSAARVRLRWSRDFHRAASPTTGGELTA